MCYLHTDIALFSIDGFVLLAGDFNARTGSASLVVSAIQADTYTKESTNTRARSPSAITCGRMAVTFLVFRRILEFLSSEKIIEMLL